MKHVKSRKIKAMVGMVLMVIMILSLSAIAWADPGNIQNKTLTIKTMAEAKTTMADLQKSGITYNLTLKCGSQEIVDYAKTQCAKIPLATIYNPVQFVLDTSLLSTVVGTSKDKDQSVVIGGNNNTSTTDKKTDTTTKTDDKKTDTTTKTDDKKTDTTTKTDDKKTDTAAKTDETSTTTAQRDNSPKTGDSTLIYGALIVGLLSIVTATSAVVIKKKRA